MDFQSTLEPAYIHLIQRPRIGFAMLAVIVDDADTGAFVISWNGSARLTGKGGDSPAHQPAAELLNQALMSAVM